MLRHISDWQSETWEWLGTLNKLVEFGFDPIAIDIPGRGLSIGKALRKVFIRMYTIKLKGQGFKLIQRRWRPQFKNRLEHEH